MVFQGTGIVVLPDNGALVPKHVADTHKCMYIIDILHLAGITRVSDITQNARNRKLEIKPLFD